LPSTGKREDDRRGGSGVDPSGKRGAKSFEVKILISNSSALKILRAIFADPAPVKAFRGKRGRGYPWNSIFSTVFTDL
jgi:hypothetical protein